MKNIITLLLAMLILAGCNTTEHSETAIPAEDGSIKTYFCPRNNCSLHLTTAINQSLERVHCAFYDLDLEDVLNALRWKIAETTMDIKLVIEEDTYDAYLPEGYVRTDKNSGYMHNKFCIFDDKKISTGSMNPTYNGNNKNNNNLIIIESEFLAKNYEEEFQELWNGIIDGDNVRYPVIKLNDKTIENYFCPEDDCAEKIIDELRSANESIYFMTFSFTHKDIANQLVLAKNRGVEIKGIFERTQKSKYSVFELLEFQGINVSYNSEGKLHHKVFIIDEKTVITGSMNPSKNGDEKNDENILIIHDEGIAQMFLNEFEKQDH